MRKRLVRLFIVFVLVDLFLGAFVELSSSEPSPTVEFPTERPLVYVDPQFSRAGQGQTFNVGVKIFNLTTNVIQDPANPMLFYPLGNLYGLEIELSWDPSVLEYVAPYSVMIPVESFPGGVLHEPVIQIEEVVDVDAGKFRIAYASMAPDAPAFNNPDVSNTVFEIKFRVKVEQASELQLTRVKLAEIGGKRAIIYEKSDGHCITPGTPIASFALFPPDGYVVANESSIFNASESYDPDGSIDLFMWSFGDGSALNTSEPVVSHDYTKVGSFEVRLRVKDNDGLISPLETMRLYVVEWRDMAIKSVRPSVETIFYGRSLTVDVTIINNGKAPENIEVSAFYNSTEVGGWELLAEKVITKLKPGEEKVVALEWKTTTLPPQTAYYGILANVTLVPYDREPSDNEMHSSTSLFVRWELRHDVALTRLSLEVVSQSNVSFGPPVLQFEDVLIYFDVAAAGTVDETFNATVLVTVPSGGTLQNRWALQNLTRFTSRQFEFTLKMSVAGNHTILVEVEGVEDADLDNNRIETMATVLTPPVIQLGSMPSEIHEGDIISLNASTSYRPGGEIADYYWEARKPSGSRYGRPQKGSAVRYTMDEVGRWIVRLVVTDNLGITYTADREPGTLGYRMEFNVDVKEKAVGPLNVTSYAVIGIIVLAAVALSIGYMFLRRPKSN